MRCASAALGIVLAWAGAASAEPAAPIDAFRGAAAAYLVLADGAPLWAAQADRRLPPASLTKLMTAVIVIETVPQEEVVTVSATAARAGGVRMGLAPGTRIAVSELLAGLLVRSANDACVALAEHVAGSEVRFVAQMNARARDWQLADTRFANACGFDAPGHYSSASDLARLAQRVLASPPLARLVALPRYMAHAAGGRTFALASTNMLLGLVPGLKGVKTGYTDRAGRCLIGYAERDGRSVMVVMLGAKDRWWDAVAMFEQAFERGAAAPRRVAAGA